MKFKLRGRLRINKKDVNKIEGELHLKVVILIVLGHSESLSECLRRTRYTLWLYI